MDGQVIGFSSSSGVWSTDTDIDLKLSSSGSNWLLTDPSDTVETYFSSAGKGLLSSVKLRNGYTQTLSYSSGSLSKVTDSYGRSLNISYSSSTGMLTGVTTPDALALSYSYTLYSSANTYQLTSVSYNTSPTTSQTYLYENNSYPYALTGITDENGNRYMTWQYDSAGRATMNEKALGADHTEVSYDDTTGNRTVTGPLGIVETYVFTYLQGVPKVTEIDRAANGTVAAASRFFTYDSAGYLATSTDWNGNQTGYINNTLGDPTTIVYASGNAVSHTTTIAYDTTWAHLPKTINTPGLKATLNYDSSGNLLTSVLTDLASQSVPYFTSGTTRTWTYTWNGTGQLLTVQLPRTDVTAKTTYGYTGGTLTSITDALSHATTVLTYKSGGLPLTVTDPNSVLTTLAYNPRNWLTSSVLTLSSSAGTLTTSLTYDSAGNLTRLTRPDSSYTSYGYDAAHRVTSIGNPLSESIVLTLNSAGNPTQALWKNSGGTTKRQQTATFDALGRLYTDVGGVSQTTTYAYDNNSNITGITDPVGYFSSASYDALNRLTAFKDPASNLTKFTYDAHDRVLTVVDPRSKTSTYVYDGFGELIQENRPEFGTSNRVLYYSSDGYVTSQTDPNGYVTNLTYDALDRVIARAYPADSTLNATLYYDSAGHGKGIGRLTGLSDKPGTLNLNYDDRGLITSNARTISGTTYTTSLSYESAGRLKTLTYASSGWIATYARDSAGQVTSLTATRPSFSPANIVTSVTHLPFGPIAALTWGNGVTDARTFDLDYRMTSVKDVGTGNLVYASYGYNANNSLTSLIDNVAAANNQTLTYTSADWLAFASGSYGSNSLTYDSAGNRKTYGSKTFTYSTTSNRMLTAAGGTTVNVNNSGNITVIGSNTNTYNKANQMATAVVGGVTSTYTYDAFGQRLKTVTGSNPTQLYSYGLNGEVLTESNSNVETDYYWLEGMPVGVVQPAAATTSYIHTDLLGTPLAATNSAKTLVWSFYPDPYGNGTVSNPGGITQNQRLPGMLADSTGNAYNVNRFYFSSFGRYLQADPIGLAGGNVNTYPYANNNVFKYVDPWGLETGSVSLGMDPLAGSPYTRTEFNWELGLLGGGIGALLLPEVVDAWGLYRLAKNLPETPMSEPLPTKQPASPGEMCPPKPEGIPDSWIEKPTKQPGGMEYINPSNANDRVRVMPGNPESEFPAQRQSYVKDQNNGSFRDVNGNPISGPTPGRSPEAHIPLGRFNFRR